MLTYENDGNVSAVFRYDNYDIVGIFNKDAYGDEYYTARFTQSACQGGIVEFTTDWFKMGFADFVSIMNGDEQLLSYDDFIAPVFIMNAVARAIETGEEVAVERYKV